MARLARCALLSPGRTERYCQVCTDAHQITNIGVFIPVPFGIHGGRPSFLFTDTCNNADTKTAQENTRPQSNTSIGRHNCIPHSAAKPQTLPGTFGQVDCLPFQIKSVKIKKKRKLTKKQKNASKTHQKHGQIHHTKNQE